MSTHTKNDFFAFKMWVSCAIIGGKGAHKKNKIMEIPELTVTQLRINFSTNNLSFFLSYFLDGCMFLPSALC